MVCLLIHHGEGLRVFAGIGRYSSQELAVKFLEMTRITRMGVGINHDRVNLAPGCGCVLIRYAVLGLITCLWPMTFHEQPPLLNLNYAAAAPEVGAWQLPRVNPLRQKPRILYLAPRVNPCRSMSAGQRQGTWTGSSPVSGDGVDHP